MELERGYLSGKLVSPKGNEVTLERASALSQRMAARINTSVGIDSAVLPRATTMRNILTKRSHGKTYGKGMRGDAIRECFGGLSRHETKKGISDHGDEGNRTGIFDRGAGRKRVPQTILMNRSYGTANTIPVYTVNAAMGNSPISVSDSNAGIRQTSPTSAFTLSSGRSNYDASTTYGSVAAWALWIGGVELAASGHNSDPWDLVIRGRVNT